MEQIPPIFRYFSNTTLFIKDPETGQVLEPYPLVKWGRGFECACTGAGPKWVPAKNVKPQPQLMKEQKTPEEDHAKDIE